MASSSRDSFRAFGGDASTGVSLDVMFWMMESQSHEVAKTHAERGTKKTGKNNTGPGPARARGGLARGAKGRARLLRPRPRPRHGGRRGGARKSFGALRARRHVGAARGLGRAAAPQGAQGLARLRRPAASELLLRGPRPSDHVRRAGVASTPTLPSAVKHIRAWSRTTRRPRPKLSGRAAGTTPNVHTIAADQTKTTTRQRRRQKSNARPPYQKSGLGRRRRGRSNRALRLRTFKATAHGRRPRPRGRARGQGW